MRSFAHDDIVGRDVAVGDSMRMSLREGLDHRTQQIERFAGGTLKPSLLTQELPEGEAVDPFERHPRDLAPLREREHPAVVGAHDGRVLEARQDLGLLKKM